MLRIQLQRFASRLLRLDRRHKRLMVLGFDILCSLFATWLAYTLRLESFHMPSATDMMVALAAVGLYLPFFHHFGLYDSMIRYSGLRTIMVAAQASLLYGLVFFLVLVLLRLEGVPRSVGILQPILFFGLVSNGRLVVSQILQSIHASRGKRRKVLIYGAGASAIQLAEMISRSPEYRLFGFVDEDPARVGRLINGKRVHSADNLKRLVQDNNIREVMLAIPNAPAELRRRVIAELASLTVRVRSVPSLSELARGTADVTQLRDLDVNDLIGRLPVARVNVVPGIAGQVVLVTGAAGSIGSELCRQIIRLRPQALVLVDHSEVGLYAIEAELAGLNRMRELGVRVHSYLASVRDPVRFGHIMAQHRPQVVYHAAAYKHVPLVEANPIEGITTNVLGTRNVVEAAWAAGVGRLVMISTDKAVRPTNIMGASKRLAEEIVQEAAARAGREGTGQVFTMVRFGNVLDSSGSVVPLFRQQIQRGGPVTVTHPEVTRYFMTIPEAVSLVLQAGEMAKGGEVFLLDMGEPVKIIDLARKMIRLSGLNEKTPDNPSGEIEIATIGLRPGEKLIEELLISADAQPTEHPQIMKAHEKHLSGKALAAELARLEAAVARHDVPEVIDVLAHTVQGYSPRSEDALAAAPQAAAGAEAGEVVPLQRNAPRAGTPPS